MSDLVKRLHDLAACKHDDLSIAKEAADEIDRLRAEVERLKAALGDVHASAKDNHLIANIARAALEGK